MHVSAKCSDTWHNLYEYMQRRLASSYLFCCSKVLSSMYIHSGTGQLGDHSDGGSIFANDSSNHVTGYQDPAN